MADQSVFDALCDLVESQMSEKERKDLFDAQLPTMVDYALRLQSLKPSRGLHYSLQQQSKKRRKNFFFINRTMRGKFMGR